MATEVGGCRESFWYEKRLGEALLRHHLSWVLKERISEGRVVGVDGEGALQR